MKRKYICRFVGGLRDGYMDYRRALNRCDDFTQDLTEWRNHGAVVRRPELDNQPMFKGYIGPMWDGTTKINGVEYVVLRYETQEVYNQLSM